MAGPRATELNARGRGRGHGDVAARALELVRRVHGSGVGIPTILYLPFCIFNIMSPILTVLYGFTGFKIQRVQPVDADARRSSAAN